MPVPVFSFHHNRTINIAFDFPDYHLYDYAMKTRPDRRLDFYRALLTALPCLFFLPELSGLSRFAGWDVTRLNLPLKWYDVQSIRDGVLPLWNHFLYAGMPQLAESESGLFYPGNFLLYLPGDFFYWAGITYIIHFVMAGLFMDLWLRGRGINRPLSFFGAVLFQTAPFLLFHITSMALLQSIVWFPLLLWLADQLLEPNGTRRKYLLGWIALLGGVLVLIGSAQMAFYQGFLLFWYLIGKVFAERNERGNRLRKSIAVLIALILGAGLIGAVVWIPAIEFSQGTVREIVGKGFYFLGSNWLTPSRLASTFYFPAYALQTEVVGWASSLIYIGLLPTLLALLRLFGIRLNWKNDAPLIVMGSVALFLALGMNNPINHLLIKFPPFSLFRYQSRMALGVLVALIPLAMHFLSARKSDQLSRLNSKTNVWVLGIILLSLLAFILNAAHAKTILIGGFILLLDAILAWWAIISLRVTNESPRFPFWIAAYIIFHLIIVFPVGRLATMRADNFNKSFEFFDLIKRDDGHPPRLLVVDVGRFSDRDLLEFNHFSPQTHLPNLCAGSTGVFAGVQTMDPYTPLRPLEWHSLIREKIGSGFSDSSETHILDIETAEFMRFLGIDAIVTSADISAIPGFDLLDENLTDYFSPDARLFISQKEEPRVWALNLNESGKYALSHLNLNPNGAITTVSSPSACVIIEISYDPNWHVTVDAEPVAVMPYQGVFCSIETGPGDHTIVFQYRPHSLKTGTVLSLSGLALLLIWMLAALFQKQSHSSLP